MAEGTPYDHIGLVRVTLRAELGRCVMRFKDLEQLGPGSVVTLDRLAGEPVEIRCRGNCIARGEVVIQDEAFAVRVIDVVDRRQNALRNTTKIRPPRRK